jgi:hypothetical protein
LSYYLTLCNTKECFGINDVFDEDLQPDIYNLKKRKSELPNKPGSEQK